MFLHYNLFSEDFEKVFKSKVIEERAKGNKSNLAFKRSLVKLQHQFDFAFSFLLNEKRVNYMKKG